MTDPIRRCAAHGFFAGEACEECGDTGEQVLDGGRRQRLSRYLSGALRHFPDEAGLSLDDGGWASFDVVVTAAENQYGWVRWEHVEGVIATDPKGRFERSEGRVRAAYGHSVPVDLEEGGDPVPPELYHGTAPRNVESIMEEGLRAMGRQAVHLSGTVEDARDVGARHAEEPVVLVVDAESMQADGNEITKRGKSVYTTEHVPPQHLDRL